MEPHNLNPQQLDAALHRNGPLLILAGAGTGKTKVITTRIANLLKDTPAEKIVGLTFTNKAAKEMKNRLIAVSGDKAKKVFLGTFHRFCLNLLRQYPEDFKTVKGFSIVSAGEQIDLVKKALEELGWMSKLNAATAHAQISNAKNYLLDIEQVKNMPPSLAQIDPELLTEVYEHYERLLKLNRVIDFDDCIFKVVKGLESCADTLEKIQNKFLYFLVDEFQDTNIAQLRLLELLAQKHNNICVVGDDDQSIYSWRGAVPQILEQFELSFKNTKLVFLEQNYRCTNVILNAANEVIQNNKQRKKKTLWSDAKEANPIQILEADNETDEANIVAQKCLSLLGRGVRPHEIAILYRSNNLAKNFELALRSMNIPYKTYGGQSFFDRKEIKDFLAYFKLIFNQNQRLAFWRIVNLPARGLGLKSLERIEQLALELKKSPFQILEEDCDFLNKDTKESAKEFTEKITQFSNFQPKSIEELKDFAQKIITEFRLLDEIRNKIIDLNTRNLKMGYLLSLPELLSKSAEYIFKDKEFNFAEFIDSLALDNTEQNNEDDKSNLSLMTVHAAKGLEFKAVFAIGLEEELFPHKNSLVTQNGLAEERRLFYVALTRAKTDLFLSYAKTRKTTTTSLPRMPSRFLKELGSSLDLKRVFEIQNELEASRKHRQDSTVKKLNDLKQLFGK